MNQGKLEVVKQEMARVNVDILGISELKWTRMAEEPEIKFPTSAGSLKKAREFQKNIDFCFIDYAKAFDCVDHNKLENSERDGNTRPPDLPLEKPVGRTGSNS